MPVVEVSLTLSFLIRGSKSETIVQCLVCHSVSVFTADLTCFIVENVRTLTHLRYVVFPKALPSLSAKSFSLGKLSLLTNFQKLFTVSIPLVL